jgi:hypothetical protein
MVMRNVRDETNSPASDSGEGPLRHFRIGRRGVLQSLAGVGAAVFATSASATHAHAHHVAAAAAAPASSATASQLLFLDQHAFDTLVLLSEQIVPGSREAKVAEFLDSLLAVESTETQKRFTQALGAFEREAREAHGKPWKALTSEQASTLLSKLSAKPDGDETRGPFDAVKRAVAETYYSTEVGMKELGWSGTVVFVPPTACAPG